MWPQLPNILFLGKKIVSLRFYSTLSEAVLAQAVVLLQVAVVDVAVLFASVDVLSTSGFTTYKGFSMS